MKNQKNKKHIHLSTLTIIFIGIAVTAAVAICVGLFSAVYSRSILRDATVSSEQVVSQSTIAVNNYLDEMKDKLSKISLQMKKSDSIEDFTKDIAITTEIQNDIYAIMIYDENGNILNCVSENKKLKDEVYRDLSFDKDLYSTQEKYILTPPHVDTLFEGEYPWVVTIALKEYQPLYNSDVFIAINFKFSEIAKYIDNIGIGRHGYCYIMDKNGNIVYHPQQQMIYSGLKEEESEAITNFADGVYTQKDKLYTIKTTQDERWRIVGVHFTEELKLERRTQIFSGIMISLACCAIITIIILVLFSRIVNAPVRELVRAMKAFEDAADSFEYKAPQNSVTELQVLNDSFEHLVKRTKQLMEKVRNEEIVLRKTELKALQAQINPHFLYNTLDSIQWMCEQGNDADAVKMVGALAKLFRISISRGHEFIKIKDEIQHAQSYLIIQSFRYRNQFSYSFHIDEELEDCLCNKITIQPLIENAIYHGIDRMVDEGEINITVCESDDNDILIIVEDNGVGMTQEQCEKILSKNRSDSGGIGVKNVDDRLKIYFGEKYGLKIESELDVGTKVTVRMPKLRKEPENEA